MLESDLPIAESSQPENAPANPIADEYHTALFRALLLQLVFAFLTLLILDGGIFRRFFCGASVVFWIVAIGVLMKRPGAWGIWYLRNGVTITFGLCFFAGMILPDDTLLDLVTHPLIERFSRPALR